MSILLVPLATLAGPPRAFGADRSYDVVVYGATPSGLMSAIQASREGLTAAVVEPSAHVGGMVTAGLSHTDTSQTPAVIGGIAKEYYSRIGSRYGKADGWDFEPKVGAAVLDQMIAESGIAVFTNAPLQESAGVTKSGAQITSFRTQNGDTFAAKIFVDATYEGDLMAQSGVSFTSGREASAQYSESLAGVQPLADDFSPAVPARDANGTLYRGISTTPVAPPGSADTLLQAFGYRFTATRIAADRIPFPRPANYDPADYALLARWLAVKKASLRRELTVYDVVTISALPNGKYDVNNNGAFSTDFIGGNVGFVEATSAQRAAMATRTREYDQGLMYFLTTDPSVSASLRASVATLGLPRDEFVDSGNFPSYMYVREARRMIGSYVMTQADEQTDVTKTDSIGMGAYRLDDHMVQRVVDASGNVRNEGGLHGTVKPYEIPYRMIVPQVAEATNLFVTGAVSASHVAFASLRMEPQYMIVGQAAGMAAKLAIAGNTTVQAVSPTVLEAELKRRGAVLALNGRLEAIVDNSDATGVTLEGDWPASKSVVGYFGADYLTDGNTTTTQSVVYRPNLPANGTYQVFVRWTSNPNRTTAAKYIVTDSAGTATIVTKNQRTGGGAWVSLGSFPLSAGHDATVTVSTADVDGYVVADAVRFLR